MTEDSHQVTTPQYRTWVRTRPSVVFGVLAVVFLALCLLAVRTPWALLAVIPAGAFGWIFFVLMLARYCFSDRGGRYQARIHELITARAEGARVLDIGCGNGHLAIQLAKLSPDRMVTGLDYWGSAWEYSKEACDRNARLEGVADRTRFVRGSAAQLPFGDDEFDCVVSCMTFHEVRDLDDKTKALAEALRVLRPGGRFVVIDLFSSPAYYPDQARIREQLAVGRAAVETDAALGALLPLPFPLNGKQVLKYARLILGRKTPD